MAGGAVRGEASVGAPLESAKLFGSGEEETSRVVSGRTIDDDAGFDMRLVGDVLVPATDLRGAINASTADF